VATLARARSRLRITPVLALALAACSPAARAPVAHSTPDPTSPVSRDCDRPLTVTPSNSALQVIPSASSSVNPAPTASAAPAPANPDSSSVVFEHELVPPVVVPPTKPTRMKHIPSGKVTIHGPPACSFCPEPRRPSRRVAVKSFWMDVTEVTVSQYRACVNARACRWLAHYSCASQFSMPGDHPVACVSWAQAKTYCEWVGKRLPTEEEWEYAAHGTDGRLYPWGNSPPSRSLLCWQHSPYHGACWTCGVGGFPAGASPFGLLDMVGNVLEWTSAQECVGNGTSQRCSVTPALKGGPGSCYSYEPTDPDKIAVPPLRSVDTGFRCAR